MNAFLFGSYQLACGLLFLMLSAILIFHRLFFRWLGFSTAFFVSYLVGSYAFFGRVPEFMNEAVLWPLCVGLFFIGTPACAAYCVFRQLSLGQVAAAVVGYLAVLLGLVFALGFGHKPEVEGFLVSLPYLLFYIGSPIVFGMGMYRGLSFIAILGLFLTFCFLTAGLLIAVTNFFNRPFGFAYELGAHTKAWIEIGSMVMALLGLPLTIGYGLMQGWERRAIFGAATLCLVVVGIVMLLVKLTIGYEFAWIQWSPA